MKITAFRALTNYATPAAAIAAVANGNAFLLNETQIFQDGTMAAPYGSGKKNNNQQTVTALRHRIHYYVRDTSLAAGYRQVFDILEADTATNQTKTITRKGKSRAATRDDDDARDVSVTKNWA